ncbi:MAG: CHAP domain-containing protein [Myxococcota bacterium]|nr:CHAP domain-containing protein [Myxococcota bacterium]
MRTLGGLLCLLCVAGCATSQSALRPESGVVLGGGRPVEALATPETSNLAMPLDEDVTAAQLEPFVEEAEEDGFPAEDERPKVVRTPREARVHQAVSKAASQATAQLSTVKYTASRKRGKAIAARASRLVGVRSLRKVTRRLPDDCTGLVRIAAEPEGVVLFDDNARVSDNGVTAIWRRARAKNALHKRKPRPGDLVFFRETYDRNRDGRRNDGLTHIAVVEKVAPDGTVTFVHRGGKGISRSRMNLKAPRDRKHNDYLRAAGGTTRAYLTGELFSTFASPDKL